jgi:hypothetical protein
MAAGLGLMALGWPAASAADVIQLVNGSRFEVDAWRDLGDAIEFASGGGVVRIAKSEVQKIEGKARRGDLPMYSSSAPASAPATAPAASSAAVSPADRAKAAKQLGDVLAEGEALFAQSYLSGVEKAGAFRRLADRWRGLDVPEPLRDAHQKGGDAIQAAAAAYTAEGPIPGEGAPDARQRIEKARADFKSVQEEIKKAGASRPGQPG